MTEDMVTLEFECEDGSVIEADFTLEEAATLKRGEPVAMYGRTRHYSLSDRIAALRARHDQLTARREEMKREFPGIEDGEWT